MVSLAVLLALASVPRAGGDWMHVDCVHVTGIERIGQSVEHSYSAVRLKNNFVYSLVRDVDGCLPYVLRTEVINAKGVFTWLDANPKYVLQIAHSSAPEVAESLLPVPLSKNDLTVRSHNSKEAVGKRVVQNGQDIVAARSCLVYQVSDPSALRRCFWLDAQTGMPLKQQDRQGSDVVYERCTTSLDVAAVASPKQFDVGEDSIVVRGLVSPSVLLWLGSNGPGPSYEEDFSRLRSQSQFEGGAWIGRIKPPSNFDYLGSIRYESQNALGAESATSKVQRDLGNGLAIPSSWSTPANDGNKHSQVPVVRRNSRQVTPFPEELGQGNDHEDSSSGTALLRSEFVDRSTGDSVSFLQFRNVGFASAFPNLKLSAGVFETVGRLGRVEEFELRNPWSMHVILWHSGGKYYALASTKLSISELKGLAVNALF